MLNYALTSLHLTGGKIFWLSDPDVALFAVIIANIWLGIPFNMILLSVGLAAIPRDLYEAAEIDGAGLFTAEPVLLSAGGSAYYDIVARKLAEVRLSRPVQVVVRSGCYLTHDSGQYTRLFEHIVRRIPADWRRHGDLVPALEVWSMVQSRPEPGLALLTMGKRDVSYDIELPIPTLWRPAGAAAARPVPAGAVLTAMNDQHAYLKLAEGFDPQVGDLVCCGISHPCTTFDKWQVMMVVEDDYRVSGAIRTFF